MAQPTLQAEGAIAVVTSGNLTVTLPSHQANDILVLLSVGWVPNTTTGANTMSLAGWTKEQSDTLITSSLIDGEWALWWKRAASGAETNPTITRPTNWDTGTDTCWAGRAFTIRNCKTSGNPFDQSVKTALQSSANQAMAAVTVSGTMRTVIQFYLSSDDANNPGTNPSSSGWTLGTYARDTTGTDVEFQTLRKSNISASTSADGTTVAAPVQGRYIYIGISFAPQNVDASGATIASGNTRNAGTVGQTLTGTTKASGAALNAGSVKLTVVGANKSSTIQTFAGSAKLVVTGATKTSSAQVFAGASAVTVAGAHRTSTATAFAPTVDQNQRVVGSLLTSSAQAQAGSVALNIVGAHRSSTATAFAGSVGQCVTGAHRASGAQLFPGVVANGIAGVHLASTGVLFTGSDAPVIAGSHQGSTGTLFAGVAGLSVVGAHRSSVAQLFPGFVGEISGVFGDRIQSTATAFAGSVAASMSGSHIDSSAQFFAGRVAQTARGAFIASTALFPGVIGTVTGPSQFVTSSADIRSRVTADAETRARLTAESDIRGTVSVGGTIRSRVTLSEVVPL